MKPKTFFSLIVMTVLLAFLVWRYETRNKVPFSSPDGCIVCHELDKDPSPSHPVAVFGCTGCHLGNPFAPEKDRAHMGLAKNPGDLRFAGFTCGRKGCHPDLVDRVEKSLMATNTGILKVMQTLWPHPPDASLSTVRELMDKPLGQSLALDHFRKMCGGCHLWRPRYPELGEIGRRGGGCTDCHILEISNPGQQDLSKKIFKHPNLTTRIPNENCLKCHNRSARIGLSYLGHFESEGYGTPYQNGGPDIRQLSGGRFYLDLPPDLHHESGMDCIDCHTEKGVMGDGSVYEHQEQQVDITCRTCHEPELRSSIPDPDLNRRLIRLNGRQPASFSNSFILSAKKSPLYHLRPGPGKKMTLFRKKDGKAIVFKTLETRKIHAAGYHQRLSCQACHSNWTPQCYGCHETRFLQYEQRDWITGKLSSGRWMEGRSYLRFRRPTLGLWPGGKIGPYAPGCQVFLESFDESGNYQKDLSFRSLVMASFDPHTTGKHAPDCMSCHLNPKVLGFGEGSLKITEKGFDFKPVYRSAESGLGIRFPLDAFVSKRGLALQLASRSQGRPFNAEELKRITQVSLCLPCHDQYDDAIYQDYKKSVSAFQAGVVPCRKGGR
jgi:hypothetical protein